MVVVEAALVVVEAGVVVPVRLFASFTSPRSSPSWLVDTGGDVEDEVPRRRSRRSKRRKRKRSGHTSTSRRTGSRSC